MNINELETYRLSDAVKFNNTLNPKLWHNEQLRPEVKQKLLAIADDFREFLGIDDLEVKDITLSGSNAAYNYTKHSDVDLHLVVDLDSVCNSDVMRELFDAKKYQYNDQHDYKIGDYDVELYVQDAKEQPKSQGIYSIVNDDWIKVPSRQRPTIDDMSVRSKYEDIGARIDAAIKSGNLVDLDSISNKIRTMRQSGLETTGEFGPENLAFKVLRSNGTLDQLRQAKLAAKDHELSLAEQERSKHLPEKKTWGEFGGMWFPGYGYYTSDKAEDPDSFDDQVQESVDKNDITDVLKKFLKVANRELKLKTVPKIIIKRDPEWSRRQNTFGRYDPDTKSITLSIGNRHVLDILRTLAHELTHAKQDQTQSMPDNAGDTGSEWENEAHATAGIIMRHWASAHPDFFSADIPDPELDEGWREKAAGLAAAACIAGTPGCATTQGMSAADAIRGVQDVGRTAQTFKGYGKAGAQEELTQRLKNELRRRQGVPEDYDPNGTPPGPEFKPTMPRGTVRVDVSDVYDWYKLGQHISDLDSVDPSKFGKGPPSTIVSFGSEDEEHKYIKDLEKLGLTTTDIDPVDPNQPKGMKRQKVDPTYNVNEAFDQPYKLRWEKGDHGDIDAIAKLSDGNYLSIMFNKETNEDNEEAWSVEFFRNNSQEVTGEGDAQRVFATVLGAIQTFIKKYKPNRIIFSASKEVEQGQNAQSRARLYDSLVQRYARAWGFRAFRADTGNKVIYELNRIKPVVAEASGYIPVNDKEARDPRYSMAMTCDIKPGEVQRQARKMGWSTNSAGIPPTLQTSGKVVGK